jgi:radical SAM superfamily enzyme YgiQ (UPF0313 family)
VRRIQRRGINVAGSFIMGLDVDRPGIGLQIAETASQYGVDILNVLFLTPLPGTELWRKMEEQGRIASADFPEDWKYYTLTHPVARYQHLHRAEIVDEMSACNREFYSLRGILGRTGRNLWSGHHPIQTLMGNLSCRINGRLNRATYGDSLRAAGVSDAVGALPATGENRHVLTAAPAAREAILD